MNCSDDPSLLPNSPFRKPFAFWTLGVISIILSFFANAGNLINLFVLTRRHMRSTMTTLLVTLAWADLVPPTVVSLNNILFYYILPQMNQSSTFLTSHIIARSLFNVLANIFTTFSNWLIVLITTFRLIVVTKPLVAKNYCNRRTARYAIILLLFLSIFINLPLFLYTSIRVHCRNEGTIKYYGLELSSILQTKYFSSLFYPTMVIISLLFPWLICFLIWLFLIRALRSAQVQLTTKTMNTAFTNDRKQDTYFRITLMIVCVLSVYMVCRSVHLFEVISLLILPSLNPTQQLFFAQIRMKLFCISNLMLTLNHGANFYIYSINPKFRLTLKLYLTYYFRRCRIKRRRAFTVFHLRRKKTNDSLDGLSVPNDFNRSLMLASPNGFVNGRKYSNIPNRDSKRKTSLRKPAKYINQFVEVNSNNENSEKSFVWKEIEQKLKHSSRR
ncbi:unnamed protein product [Adineta steineri]|uniref:G-protein coupled receptors family 1 profile domain-containing protein n=1 Tax=Adineta steineri TaxID=433720 RepID=A0A814YBC0_9BILA|nr:unnamed protein product [Adineta steineri]CAF3716604.1 unnamed protein product [Adineta steineri]